MTKKYYVVLPQSLIFLFCFLDKYKDHLDRVKKDRSHPTSSPNSSNGLATTGQSQQVPQDQLESAFFEKSWPSGHDLSRPSSSATLQNGMSASSFSNSRSLSKYGQSTHSLYQDGVSLEGLAEAHQRPDLVPVTRKFMEMLKIIYCTSVNFIVTKEIATDCY